MYLPVFVLLIQVVTRRDHLSVDETLELREPSDVVLIVNDFL